MADEILQERPAAPPSPPVRPTRIMKKNLSEVATALSKRLSALFVRDASGNRPCYGGTEKFQSDPHFRDLVLFHEYFHGDNGAGLGAAHQTGWTALVAKLLQQSGE